MSSNRLSKKLASLPKTTGVYLLKNEKGEPIYIGKARNLRDRVRWYFQNSSDLSPKTKRMVSAVKEIDYLETVSELESLLLEAALIKQHRPKYNVVWKDDKRPLYIKIDTRKEFPTVSTCRLQEDKGCLYFGPFTSSRIARNILRSLRRIFPYCSQKNHQRPCFYSHLQLCQPCPAEIMKMPEEQAKQAKKQYKKSINYLTKVLAGDTQEVLSLLKQEMDRYSQRGQFEQAARVRDQIDGLQRLNQVRFTAMDYLRNPNLAEDVYQTELAELKNCFIKWAKKYPLAFEPPSHLRRIECIDISNIFGLAASGSLVVFINGQAQPSLYRRFRIKADNKINDPAMINEVVKRRLRHKEWPYPQLLVIDGGRSQVSSAMKACPHNIKLPIIGLAKVEETIIIPLASGKFCRITLPADSAALALLKRIRDESHRFAKRYHQWLRRKATFSAEFDINFRTC